MPNIIGEPIPDYVAKQINHRQRIHGSGQDGTVRTAEQIAYLNSKTAWVKLASGVSLNDARVTEEKLRGGTDQMPGSTLATRYVLFNGTSHIENGYLTQRGTDPQKDNVTDYYTGTYNVNAFTENSEFGLVPMPGIESAEIKCMNRGSIKRATVKIKCYSPEQFQILDLLYMRIGYTMLLEWGNSLYWSNSQDNLQEMGYTLVEDPDGFFSDSIKTYYDMIPRIKKYRADKSGNYDALVARVVNFSWQFAQDGSYDITLELLSMGDVIESLKTNISPNPDILKFVDDTYVNSTETSPPSTSQITPPSSNVISSYLYYQSKLNQNPANYSTEKIYIELQGTPTQMGHFIKPVAGEIFTPQGLETWGPYTNKQEAINAIQTKYAGASEKSTSLNLPSNSFWVDAVHDEYGLNSSKYTVYYQPTLSTTSQSSNQEIKDVAFIEYSNAAKDDYLLGYYMRFGHLLDFLRKYVIPNIHNGNQPIAKMLTIDSNTYSSLMYHFPFQVSLDPQVCIVNNLDEPVGSKHYFHQLKHWINPDKKGSAYMMNIYIHHQTIDSCLKNNLDEKGNLSLFNFLDSICKELNKALGGINTLEPIIDEEENTIRIIDQSYYEPKPRKYELELYGYNHDFKSSNFVRNFNLKTEITPDFANMAAISSTAGGYVKGVENTMFSKWNKGLNDRLQPEISAPLSTGFSNSRDEVKETYLKKFWWGHKSAFGLKNTPEIELDPQIIENNVSIVSEFYKSIQAEIQLNVDEKYASPTNGFVPINLGVTMDGIGGIKIYNELCVASRFLPPRYPENLHFIIRGVHHKLSNSDWETSVETTSIANSDNNGSHYMPYDKLFAEVKKILGETNEQVTNTSMRINTQIKNNTPFISKVKQIASNLSIKPEYLMAIMEIESAGTFSPSIRNSLGYVGLIQFGKPAAQDLGTTRDKLASMSDLEQLDYVERYFKKSKLPKNASASTIYTAVFMPKFINEPESFHFPPYAWVQNPALRDPTKPGMPITKSYLGKLVEKRAVNYKNI